MLASDLLEREWTVESGEKLIDAVLAAVEFVLGRDLVEEMDDVGLAEQVDWNARVGFEQDACTFPANRIECLLRIEIHAAFAGSGSSVVVRINS